jgi:replicative DNA helicase
MDLAWFTLDEQIVNLREFSENPQQRIRTGLHDIDNLCGGPAPGEVFMIVGRSFTGKSLVGQNIVWRNRHLPSIFFSLEMPYIQAIQRMYAMWADVPARDVQDMTEHGTLPMHVDLMAQDFPMHRIVDLSGINLDIMSTYNWMFEEYYGQRPAFVVIDYLELVGGAKKSGEGWSATEVQATSLKDWAKQEEMSVFVLHQTNKQENPWNPPTENSPRGAGYTEADFVVGMWQPWRDPDIEAVEYTFLRNQIWFNVLKNRAYGETSHRELKFNLKPSLRLESYDIT